MHPLFPRRHISVSPPGPQNFTTEDFPFSAGSIIQIDATGMIGSGVFLTGQTPPSGWDMTADNPGDGWPLTNPPNNKRYSLIAKINDEPWFYVGNTLTVISDGSQDPAHLRFAVNRPWVDRDAIGPDRGDGAWDVSWQVFALDMGEEMPGAACFMTPPPSPNAACLAATMRLNQLRDMANGDACTTLRAARRSRDTDNLLMIAAWGAFGVLATAVLAVGGIAATSMVWLVPHGPADLPRAAATAAATVATAVATGGANASSGGIWTLIFFWI